MVDQNKQPPEMTIEELRALPEIGMVYEEIIINGERTMAPADPPIMFGSTSIAFFAGENGRIYAVQKEVGGQLWKKAIF